MTDVLNCSPIEIARQLTIKEWSLWVEIKPWECLGLAWTKKDKEERAPNGTPRELQSVSLALNLVVVLAMMDRFNYVSAWVSNTILRTEDHKERVKVVKKFLDIAAELKKLGNLNGAFEMMAGFSFGPVFRLKKTFEVRYPSCEPAWLTLSFSLSLKTRGTSAYSKISSSYATQQEVTQISEIQSNHSIPLSFHFWECISLI